MTHGITNRDSQLYIGKPAWHGMGTTLPENDPIRFDRHRAIVAAGMDWETDLRPIQTADGLAIKDRKAVVRKGKNAEPDEVLGVVGEYYRPLQNDQHLAFFDPFLESKECQFETMGTLFSGRIVWVLATINREDSVIVPDSAKPDAVRKYLLITSSHDGSKATRVGFTPTRVVCWNTLSYSLKDEASSLLRVKHTKTQLTALASIRETINIVDEKFEANAEQFRRMSQFAINRDDLSKYIERVFDVDPDDKIAKKTQNILDEVMELAENGIGTEYAPNTLWTAYNGVTEYVTHRQGRTADNRLHSQWFGNGQKLIDRATSLALQLMS